MVFPNRKTRCCYSQIAVALLVTWQASRNVQAAAPVCAMPACPNNPATGCQYIELGKSKGGCPICYKPAYLGCSSSSALQPMVCGPGTAKPVCPTFSCASATAYTLSKTNQGCSQAKARIDSVAFSASTFNMAGVIVNTFTSFCNDPHVDMVAAAAATAATAYADALAKTLIQYNTYICSCVTPGSPLPGGTGYTTVSADVQAVANAYATSFASALAEASTDCGQEVVAAAEANAQSTANDIKLAIDSVYKKFVNNGNGCTAVALQTQLKTSIARAIACSFVEVFAAAAKSGDSEVDANMQPTGQAASCAQVFAVAAGDSNSIQQCYSGLGCGCDAATYGYDNMDFEKSSFTDGAPKWTPGNPSAVSIMKQAQLYTHTLWPSKGEQFAAIVAGCPTNTLTTSLTIPSCAKKVTMDWVFYCGDYLPFDDSSSIEISIVDAFDNSNVISKATVSSCNAVGGQYKASNAGQWSKLTMDVGAGGSYLLTVKTASTNNLDCNLASVLYVDNLSFDAI